MALERITMKEWDEVGCGSSESERQISFGSNIQLLANDQFLNICSVAFIVECTKGLGRVTGAFPE